MHLRLHWPFISNDFICIGNVSQILALLLTRKRRYSLVKNIALNASQNPIYRKQGLKYFCLTFFFKKKLGLSFILMYSYLIYAPGKFVFRKQGLRNECWLPSTVSVDHSVTHPPCNRKELLQADSSFPHIDCWLSSDDSIKHLCDCGNYSFTQFKF